ncbi:chaplin family protein [Asanoa sp. NPDC050611]|uniref:chaplin family protein n=1 Tax=Asanoa sp. NPDC050611 TaxID=3157098 RepID=UPI0033FB4CB7
MTIKRRLANAALPAAGLAVVAGALALSGQAAAAAPLGDGAGLGETGDPGATAAAAATDRAQLVTDEVRDATDRALAAVGEAPADDDADGGDDEGASKGPSDLPAAAKFGSGVSHIATGHNAGILNGNQVVVPVQVDVNLCGNSIAVLGNAAASCGDDDEEPPADEEPPPPTDQEEPPPVPLPRPVEEPPVAPPVAEPELPRTGLPVGSIAGFGGLLTAGGAAMQLAGVRGRYVGRHRRRPRPS